MFGCNRYCVWYLLHLFTILITIGDSIINVSRNIGAIFDCSLTMKDHIQANCRACYCPIRNIGKVRRHLKKDAAITIIHAFVPSKLYYMNALLYGPPKYLLNKLKQIQSKGARIVCMMTCRGHITPMLNNFHWLPIDFRLEFIILFTAFKMLQS